jgi:hypothetical protein
MRKTTFQLLFVSLSLLLFGVSCSEDNLQLADNQNLISSCECTSYLTQNVGIPTFASIENFRDAYDCIKECHYGLLEEIDNQYPDIGSEGYDSLVEQGIIDEWAAIDAFANYGNYKSLLRKDLEIEDQWLEDGAVIADVPEETIGDDFMKAMLDENCNVVINGDTINVCDGFAINKLSWCTPIGGNSETFQSGNYRIKVSGGVFHSTSWIAGSVVYGKVTAYKRKNGKWKRNRERLSVGATCNVRRSPLNECELLNAPAITGFISKRTKSLTVTKVNWLNPQIWYKDPFDPMNPNPDGLVNGSSQDAAAIIGF